MAGDLLTPDAVLARIPQQEPFRFVDRILEIDDQHVVSTYRWREGADFYRGHFPARPVTPGVLVLESMAQGGVVPLGIYLYAKELGLAEAEKRVTLFTDATVEFCAVVEPGSQVCIRGRRLFFRRMKLRVEVEMSREDGTLVASASLSGIGVPR